LCCDFAPATHRLALDDFSFPIRATDGRHRSIGARGLIAVTRADVTDTNLQGSIQWRFASQPAEKS
jgi:hypothetical protein